MKFNHVLLAEDDQLDAKLTLDALKGFSEGDVVVVSDGQAVLDYLYRRNAYANRREGNPTALFLDLKMPKVDGLSALQQIKTDDSLKLIPVVMLTSSREARDLTACYASGANAYVVKPLHIEEFEKVVHQLGSFWGKINEPPPENGTSSLFSSQVA